MASGDLFSRDNNPATSSILDQEITALLCLIKTWLYSPHVQLVQGIHRGGVAGWLTGENQPAFVYGEITGYYLTWLAFLWKASGPAPEVLSRMEMAVGWLDRYWVGERAPLTRHHLTSGAEGDFRNHAFFSFDAVMMLRGLCQVRPWVDPLTSEPMIARMEAHVSRFIDGENGFAPVWTAEDIASGPNALPDRWSTRPGPFQLKAASALLCMDDPLEDSEIIAGARRLFKKWRGIGALSLKNPSELHGAFYALEGLLVYGIFFEERSILTLASEWLNDGVMPVLLDQAVHGAPGSWASVRSDVLAQALRMGSILKGVGLGGPGDDALIDDLARSLIMRIGGDGSLCFDPSSSPRIKHQNTWAAMFAHQALFFYHTLKQAKRIDHGWIYLLI